MKKILLLLFLIIFIFLCCENMELKYYFGIKIENNGYDAHQVGFGTSSSNIIVDCELIASGDMSETFNVPTGCNMYQYVSSQWGYEDNFNFEIGKSYLILISSGTPDTYYIIEQ